MIIWLSIPRFLSLGQLLSTHGIFNFWWHFMYRKKQQETTNYFHGFIFGAMFLNTEKQPTTITKTTRCDQQKSWWTMHPWALLLIRQNYETTINFNQDATNINLGKLKAHGFVFEHVWIILKLQNNNQEKQPRYVTLKSIQQKINTQVLPSDPFRRG